MTQPILHNLRFEGYQNRTSNSMILPKKFMFSNHQIKIILSTALHIKFKFPSGWLQWPHWLHQPWWPLQPRLPQQPPWTQKYQKCKRFRYWVVFLASATWTASICGIDHWKPNIAVIFGNLSFRGCGGQPLSLLWNIRVKSQMPAATEHDFKEKSTKLLILLPLRTIYFRTCQCETPCILLYFRWSVIICMNLLSTYRYPWSFYTFFLWN